MQLNDSQEEMVELAQELGSRNPRLTTKTRCPYCGKFTLYLYASDKKARCVNDDCKRDWMTFEQVEAEHFRRMMTYKDSAQK